MVEIKKIYQETYGKTLENALQVWIFIFNENNYDDGNY